MVSLKEILPAYWIGEEIGHGARSVVHEVKRKSDGQRFAAKFVPVREDADLEIIRHLENEHEILKALHTEASPGARLIVEPVELLTVRRWFKTQAACHVMEYAPGRTLAEYHDYTLTPTLKIFEQVCVVLAHVHDAGYVHADLKPNNIMVDAGSGVKLIDFGFALPTGTALRGIKGSWGYLAPEQTGGTLNTRTDVFNLGAIMYWVFTGENLPNIIDDSGANGFVPRKFRLTPPAHLNPDVPADLSDHILRCCEYKASRRPSVTEVRTFLADLLLRLRLTQ